jgi:hypothetical protein
MIYLSITCRDQKTTFERKCHSFCKFTYEKHFLKKQMRIVLGKKRQMLKEESDVTNYTTSDL